MKNAVNEKNKGNITREKRHDIGLFQKNLGGRRHFQTPHTQDKKLCDPTPDKSTDQEPNLKIAAYYQQSE